MEKKLFFVFNPKAGKGQIRNHLLDIIDLFNKNGYEVIAYATQAARDAYEKVLEYKDQVDLIVCSGGDGTLDEVVTAVMHSGCDLPIGYIPAGSTNDFAQSLFMPKNMLEAAENLMNEEIYSCDIGTFNKQVFAYIAAFGLFTDVSYMTDQNLKNILGHMAYLLEGVQRIFDIKSYHLAIEADGQPEVIEDDFIYGMITNSRSVGGFKHITGKNVDMDDGLFEVTLVSMPRNPLELNEILTNLLAGEAKTSRIHVFKTRRLMIRGDNEVPWTLDGEFGGNVKDVEIKNHHRALKLYLKSTKV